MTPNVAAEQARVGAARAKLWLPTPRLKTLKDAARFVERVGFALAYPADQVLAPSLYEGVAGPDAVAWRDGMGKAESLVWEWKDALPEAGLAWAGKLIHKRASVVAPKLLTLLYPGDGEPDDHRSFTLTPEAHRIADALAGGALPTSELREIVGNKSRYDRASVQLHQHLLVTSAGVREQRAGWPVGLIDLTCRLFDVGGRFDARTAVEIYLSTVITATPRDLSRTFGWPLATAKGELG
jgi:hypothetical protein